MEQSHSAPDELTSNYDFEEVKRVKEWMLAIDDAREPGSGENVSELIRAMHANCDPDVIQLLGEYRRRGVRLPQTDLEQ
ncbi:MAG: hypothetical protein ABIQ64_02680 [Candidatus Saccharimonadales bacterium]